MVEVDVGKVEALAGQVVGLMGGAAVTAGIIVGEQLGFYRALAGAAQPLSADGLAQATSSHPCLTRERLDGQAAAGLLGYDPATDRSSISAEATMVLAGEDSPAFVAGGGSVADIGCGLGHSCTVLAAAFPHAQVHGFDFHGPSIDATRANAANTGLADRVSFDVASSTTHGGSNDLICFFDCLHDMGDPVGTTRHARQRMNPGGTVRLVEPFALDGRAAKIAGNPAASFNIVYEARS